MAERLLREIKVDAEQVQSAASRLDGLTKSSSATWVDDRQWNEIKSAEEDMQIKLWHLERIQAAMSSAERKQLDQSKPMIEQIETRTHELRLLLLRGKKRANSGARRFGQLTAAGSPVGQRH